MRWVRRAWVAAAAAAFALLVYLPRVAPTLSLQGDSAVFVSAAATWGVPQPSGYPLYTTLGFFASKVPVGEIPHRLHLLSAILHALTVAVVVRIVQRLTRSKIAAFSAGLSLAFSRAFFLGSLYAEVFPLNDLFAAIALLVGLEVHRRAEEPDRPLLAMAVVAGLASAHHQTIALLAPALAILVFPALRARLAAVPRLFLVFAAPIVAFHALVLIAARRDPLPLWGEPRDLSSVLALATRADYGGLFSPHLGKKDVDDGTLVGAWVDMAATSFTPVLIGIALVGAVSLFRREEGRDRSIFWSLVLAVAVTGPIFSMMNVLDVEQEHGRAFAERFSTLSAVPIAILIGVGLAAIKKVLQRHLPVAAVRVAVGLAFVAPLASHATACDLRNNRRGIQVAHDLLRGVPDGSLVLVSGDALNGAALYVCGVERRCGRTLMFTPGQLHLPWRVAQLRRRYPDLVVPAPAGKFATTRELVAANLDRRPIFLTPQLLDLEPPLRDAFQYLPDGLLVRVLPDESALEAAKTTFVDKARRFASGEGCEGCGMARSQLVAPSLETTLPMLYALAYENHARVLAAWFQEPALAAQLAERAERADPEIKKLRGP